MLSTRLPAVFRSTGSEGIGFSARGVLRKRPALPAHVPPAPWSGADPCSRVSTARLCSGKFRNHIEALRKKGHEPGYFVKMRYFENIAGMGRGVET